MPRDPLTIVHGPLTDRLAILHGWASDAEVRRGSPASRPARTPGGSWPGLADERLRPCVGLGFGTAASAAAAGPAIVYKRVRLQIFRTGRSERGVRAVYFRRMKFMEGRE